VSTPFLGQIMLCSFNFAPKGWALCDGQLLPINQNQALFSLLGTNYGGDGRVNFGLPDLRSRVPFHTGSGLAFAQRGGEEAHTLSGGEMPAHTHLVTTGALAADQVSPAGHYVASSGRAAFAPSANGVMRTGSVSTVGSTQPHENRPPFLVLNFVIALQGIFPSQT